MISVPFEMEQVEVGMLIPVIPLPEKSQKECSISKQLIQDLDYSIPLIPPFTPKVKVIGIRPWPLSKIVFHLS